VKRAHKLHGQKLIVADLRRNEMAERSDLFISTRPAFAISLIVPASPPIPTVRNKPSVAGDWQ
jgi:predicted molibdopterin-dependent oxidoreductase YjgC